MGVANKLLHLCDLSSGGVVLAHCFREASPWWLSSTHLGGGNAWRRLFVPFSTFVFSAQDGTKDLEHIAQGSTTELYAQFYTLFFVSWKAKRRGHVRWGQGKLNTPRKWPLPTPPSTFYHLLPMSSNCDSKRGYSVHSSSWLSDCAWKHPHGHTRRSASLISYSVVNPKKLINISHYRCGSLIP